MLNCFPDACHRAAMTAPARILLVPRPETHHFKYNSTRTYTYSSPSFKGHPLDGTSYLERTQMLATSTMKKNALMFPLTIRQSDTSLIRTELFYRRGVFIRWGATVQSNPHRIATHAT